jgi:drug/metabolite transporter (DMT)-like permease
MDVNGWSVEHGHVGAIFCLLSAAGFGLMAVFAKLAYGEGVSVETLLVGRFGLAAAVLVCLCAATGAFRGVTRRTVAIGLAMGGVGYSAQAGLYLAAVARGDASQAALVFSIYPVTVMGAAILIGREQVSRRRLVALVLALAGATLVLGGAGGAGFDPVSAALSLGSAAVYTCYILVGDRVVGDVPPVPLTTFVCLGGAITWGALGSVTGGVDLTVSARGWTWILAIVLVSTVGAILLFFAGLSLVGPGTAALLSAVEPVVTVAGVALVLHEALTGVQACGGALVLAAVVILQWRSRFTGSAAGEPVVVTPVTPDRGLARC